MSDTPTRILLIGSNGQVGRALRPALAVLGEVHALDRSALDLTDTEAIRATVRSARPTVIVNAAAYTAVDRAETEHALAMAINATAPGVLAEEARRAHAVLVHYSTDYVFDGTKPAPYVETDTPNPLNAYGRSKLAGERAVQRAGGPHFILRTSWVYAAEGANFVNTILRLARERPELRIVDDQIGAPTWARAIADLTVHMLASALGRPDPPYGIYHVTATGAVTWFGFARAIVAEAQRQLGIAPPRLLPITTAEYRLPAKRPANSRLDLSRLENRFGLRPDSWQRMLTQCLEEKWRH